MYATALFAIIANSAVLVHLRAPDSKTTVR